MPKAYDLIIDFVETHEREDIHDVSDILKGALTVLAILQEEANLDFESVLKYHRQDTPSGFDFDYPYRKGATC